MHNLSDALLYVLTDHGGMSWSAFQNMFDYLDAKGGATHLGFFKELRYRRRRVVRALDALAHAEFDFDGNGSVYVTPSVFARLPQPGMPQAVLAGARSPDAIAQVTAVVRDIGRQARLSMCPQSAEVSLVPRRVVIQAESEDVLASVARTLGVRFEGNPPAWLISQFVVSLEEYLASRTWSVTRELNWERTDFDPLRLRFGSNNEASGQWRLSRYREPDRGTTEFVLWLGGSGMAVDPDWGFIFAVPSGTPLPQLLSRSLALCSGFAPRFIAADRIRCLSRERWGFDLYRSVPPQVVEMVAARLGQHIARCVIAHALPGDAT
jgi:hypothetical protein